MIKTCYVDKIEFGPQADGVDNQMKITFKLAKVGKKKTIIYGVAYGASIVGCDASPMDVAEKFIIIGKALADKYNLTYRFIPWGNIKETI